MNTPRPNLTKIIATVGTPNTPSGNADTLRRLADAGANVFRLNFSHGTLDATGQTLAMIREIEHEFGRPLGVLGDLAGPKIRVGQVIDGGVTVKAGQDVIFQKEEIVADGPRFSTTMPSMIDDLEPGQKLLVNDGAIRMLVVERDNESSDSVVCRVMTGGLITSRKGINLPNTNLQVEAITDYDWQCVDWAVQNRLDFLALSFVRRAEDVKRLRARLDELCQNEQRRRIPVVAKIEKPEAIDNLSAILNVTDVVMIARGDLGVEMDLAEVPVIQKRIIDQARRFPRPTIVATQMLETMMHSPTPTRAEASDVANAILDGAGTVMLSGETAVGDWPVLAVETMRRIAERTEPYFNECEPERHDRDQHSYCRMRAGHWTDGLAEGARRVVCDVGAKCIVAWSQSGRAALYLSETRFPVPIIACSDDIDTVRRITLLRGIIPLQRKRPENLDAFTREMDALILESQWAEPGDPILIIAGSPIGLGGATNTLAVHYLGHTQAEES